ncbi:hypothetical protein Salat_0224900 [Sesamum alatum]|uniref:Uncharacterized protein n=1 Tax=Sesamum alatum TaxID=300844 RepID=A0AAE2CY86_9LAMI|nr:hypothetical protein Salat_0224900 [Sesamum alatum]
MSDTIRILEGFVDPGPASPFGSWLCAAAPSGRMPCVLPILARVLRRTSSVVRGSSSRLSEDRNFSSSGAAPRSPAVGGSVESVVWRGIGTLDAAVAGQGHGNYRAGTLGFLLEGLGPEVPGQSDFLVAGMYQRGPFAETPWITWAT